MNYFIKPVLLTGMLALGSMGMAVNAKEPVKIGVTVNDNRADGHYEIQTVYETRVDSDGNTYQVPVQRSVWVEDTVIYGSSPSYYPYYRSGPSVYFGFGGGHWGHHHHHH